MDIANVTDLTIIITEGRCAFEEKYGIKPTEISMHRNVYEHLCFEANRKYISERHPTGLITNISKLDGMKILIQEEKQSLYYIIFCGIKAFSTKQRLLWQIPEDFIFARAEEADNKTFFNKRRRMLRPM